MNTFLAHLFILITILLGLYGQVVLKWQVNMAPPPPGDWGGKVAYALTMLTNPWVLSSLFCAFLGMLSWMLALTKTDLSYAYPFTSLSFVLVLAMSAYFFNEPVTARKVLGMALIVAGIVVGSR
jgi:multidrug transporter EmrE-like cation transporter